MSDHSDINSVRRLIVEITKKYDAKIAELNNEMKGLKMTIESLQEQLENQEDYFYLFDDRKRSTFQNDC